MADNKEFKRLLINKAFQLSRNVLALVDEFPNKRAAWVISDQLLRAATSIGANIIEAQAASSSQSILTLRNKSKF